MLKSKAAVARWKLRKVKLGVLRPWLVVPAIIIGATLLSQIERFAHKGTLLGYHVRDVAITKTAMPKERGTNAENISQVCKILSEDFVGNQLKQAVTASVLLPDRTEPEPFSSCTYRIKQSPYYSVSASLRERSSEDLSRQSVSTLTKRAEKLELKGADEAYYIDRTNQIVARKQNKVITVSAAIPGKENAISKDVVKLLGEKLLQ